MGKLQRLTYGFKKKVASVREKKIFARINFHMDYFV